MEEESKKTTSVVNHFAEGSNCQVFNGNITGSVFNMPGAIVNQYTSAPQNETLAEGEEDVAKELMNIFYNDANAVNDFLRKIKGAAPMDVTKEVNRLISEGIVSNISCKKTLWKILNKHGYYDRGLNNWYDQITTKRN